mmetsp:Transcript_22940/g.55551  ORF Transcript_22940/g.55551 Transcript_22940/m.55551 type:complete len:340 (+) Transcript_22940:338-1357(+)
MVVDAAARQCKYRIHPLLEKWGQTEDNVCFPVILLPIRAQYIDVVSLSTWFQNLTCKRPLLVLLRDHIEHSVIVYQHILELLLPVVDNNTGSQVFHNFRLFGTRCGGHTGIQNVGGILDAKRTHSSGSGLNENFPLLVNWVSAPILHHRLKRLHDSQAHQGQCRGFSERDALRSMRHDRMIHNDVLLHGSPTLPHQRQHPIHCVTIAKRPDVCPGLFNSTRKIIAGNLRQRHHLFRVWIAPLLEIHGVDGGRNHLDQKLRVGAADRSRDLPQFDHGSVSNFRELRCFHLQRRVLRCAWVFGMRCHQEIQLIAKNPQHNHNMQQQNFEHGSQNTHGCNCL